MASTKVSVNSSSSINTNLNVEHDYQREHENKDPFTAECGIEGIRPDIIPIPTKEIEREIGRRNGTRTATGKPIITKEWKRCCMCENIPIKTAHYKLEGIVRIEQYCDTCGEKQFG